MSNFHQSLPILPILLNIWQGFTISANSISKLTNLSKWCQILQMFGECFYCRNVLQNIWKMITFIPDFQPSLYLRRMEGHQERGFVSCRGRRHLSLGASHAAIQAASEWKKERTLGLLGLESLSWKQNCFEKYICTNRHTSSSCERFIVLENLWLHRWYSPALALQTCSIDDIRGLVVP